MPLRAWPQYGVLVGLRVQLTYGLCRTKDSPTSSLARADATPVSSPWGSETPVSN